MMHRSVLPVDSLTISYLEYKNSGPQIIFIHGNSGNGESFLSQIETVGSKGWQAIVPDLPGHGASSRDDRADIDESVYTVDYHADILASFLRTLGVVEPVVVGHSLGGHIALRLSVRIRVRGVFIFGTPPLETFEDLGRGFLPREETQSAFRGPVTEDEGRKLIRLFSDDENCRADYLGYFFATDPKSRRNLGASLRPGESFGEVSILHSLSCPVCVGLGERDPIISGEYLRDLMETMDPEKEAVFFPDCGHSPHMDRPELFNPLFLRFLRDVENRSGKETG